MLLITDVAQKVAVDKQRSIAESCAHSLLCLPQFSWVIQHAADWCDRAREIHQEERLMRKQGIEPVLGATIRGLMGRSRLNSCPGVRVSWQWEEEPSSSDPDPGGSVHVRWLRRANPEGMLNHPVPCSTARCVPPSCSVSIPRLYLVTRVCLSQVSASSREGQVSIWHWEWERHCSHWGPKACTSLSKQVNITSFSSVLQKK